MEELGGVDAAPPTLPWTLRADQAWPFLLARLRTRGKWLLPVPVVAGTLATFDQGLTGLVRAVLVTVALLGVPLLGVVVGTLLYGRSTITVTHTELVVKRVRRRVLPRSDVGGLVLGFFTVLPNDLAGMQVAVVRRDGTRFTQLPLFSWGGEGVATLALALDVEPRWQQEEDERLRSLSSRHPWRVALVGGTVLFVVIVAGVWAVVARQEARHDEVVRATDRAWTAYVEDELATGPLPLALPPSASLTGGEDAGDAVTARVELVGSQRGGELDPAQVAATRATACDFEPGGEVRTDVELTVSLAGEDGETTRQVRLDCALDPAPLDVWLRELARRPPGADVQEVRLDLGGLARGLEVDLRLPRDDAASLDRVLALVTAEPLTATRARVRLVHEGEDGDLREAVLDPRDPDAAASADEAREQWAQPRG